MIIGKIKSNFDYFSVGLQNMICYWNKTHCVKSVRIRSYFGPHFPTFGLNKERYGVSLHIQSECGKMRTRITPNTDTFHAVLDSRILSFLALSFSHFFDITSLTCCNCSQENTCNRVLLSKVTGFWPATLLKKYSFMSVFLDVLQIFWEQLFLRTPPMACFCFWWLHNPPLVAP